MATGSPPWPHPGAILCGGRSSRMGEPKHDLKLPDGRTMFDAVADAMRDVCGSLVVLGPDDIRPDLPHVRDLREGQGPLAGIEALLASGLDDRYLVVPCDVPNLGADLLQRLTDAPPARVAVFHKSDQTDPDCLPMRIESNCLAEVRALLDEGRRAVRRLFDRVDVEYVAIEGPDADGLVNVNTPEEFDSLHGA